MGKRKYRYLCLIIMRNYFICKKDEPFLHTSLSNVLVFFAQEE